VLQWEIRKPSKLRPAERVRLKRKSTEAVT